MQTTDEIGRVARAFDQVHAEAVRLAGTEAQLRSNLNAMFISLSRRSVPLIDRLSRMIDNLEQNEDDPDQLSHLFSMDHLVTRMRRNSENLLVLAGEEPVRKWSEPVPLTDVARAAAAEIEQYGRVALTVQPGIMVSGQAAADVVHLLAELLENATLFSPRNTQVQVAAADAPGGGVLIEIRDEGVGVSTSPARRDELAARPPARRGRVGLQAHGPVRGLPAGGAARHQGQAPRGRAAGPDRPGLAARHPDQPRAAADGRHALAPAARGRHVQRGHGVRRRPHPALGAALAAAHGTSGLRQRTTGRHGGGGTASACSPPAATSPSSAAGRRRGRWVRRQDAVRPGPGRVRAAVRVGRRGSSGSASSGRARLPASSGLAAAPRRAAGSDRRRGPDGRGTGRRRLAGRGSGRRRDAPGRPQRLAAGGPAVEPPPTRQTQAGLPKRVPQANMAFAGPPSGYDAHRPDEAPVLGAPPGPGSGPQQQAPRRRSPEAARNRLAGFQLGSRDAAQAGSTPGWAPYAGEETSR